ncbi:MAG TPA: hypothetical protein DCQ50_06535 [Chryseobacterium sp.]|nr:hypothetical protein [Chryseobacterium sp.]
MKSKILIIIAIVFCNNAYSQTYKALNNVEIGTGFILIRSTKVKDCSQTINKGATIKKTTTFKNTSTDNEETYSISEEKKVSDNEEIKVDKLITSKLESFKGKANLYIDEKDKSIIHINYWLNNFYELKSGTKINIIERKLGCDEKYSETSKITTLNEDTKYNLWRCEVSEISTNPSFYINSNKVIEVYKTNSTDIDYYLVNKYDKDADYTIQLNNRDYLSLKETELEFGPITIPIKFRPSFTKNNIKIQQDFSSDLNLGIFGGYKIGKYRARYERGIGFTQLPTSFSCTIGGILGLSSTNLDKNNTTVGDNPITTESKQSIGVISPGIGIMFSIYNFQIGLFTGFDIGIGTNSKNWNYNNRNWLGLGLAYNLNNFWKK